jgi:hypothetical protein
MGQDRHFFRVAIYGLEKGVLPEPDPEDVSRTLVYRLRIDDQDERIIVKVVPINLLKHHFSRMSTSVLSSVITRVRVADK